MKKGELIIVFVTISLILSIGLISGISEKDEEGLLTNVLNYIGWLFGGVFEEGYGYGEIVLQCDKAPYCSECECEDESLELNVLEGVKLFFQNIWEDFKSIFNFQSEIVPKTLNEEIKNCKNIICKNECYNEKCEKEIKECGCEIPCSDCMNRQLESTKEDLEKLKCNVDLTIIKAKLINNDFLVNDFKEDNCYLVLPETDNNVFPLKYRIQEGSIKEWSPDGENWQTINNPNIQINGKWRNPTHENIQLINQLNENNGALGILEKEGEKRGTKAYEECCQFVIAKESEFNFNPLVPDSIKNPMINFRTEFINNQFVIDAWKENEDWIELKNANFMNIPKTKGNKEILLEVLKSGGDIESLERIKRKVNGCDLIESKEYKQAIDPYAELMKELDGLEVLCLDLYAEIDDMRRDIYLRNLDYESARDVYLERSKSKDDETRSKSFYELGKIEFSQGDLAKASEYFREAKKYPLNEEAKKASEDLQLDILGRVYNKIGGERIEIMNEFEKTLGYVEPGDFTKTPWKTFIDYLKNSGNIVLGSGPALLGTPEFSRNNQLAFEVAGKNQILGDQQGGILVLSSLISKGYDINELITANWNQRKEIVSKAYEIDEYITDQNKLEKYYEKNVGNYLDLVDGSIRKNTIINMMVDEGKTLEEAREIANLDGRYNSLAWKLTYVALDAFNNPDIMRMVSGGNKEEMLNSWDHLTYGIREDNEKLIGDDFLFITGGDYEGSHKDSVEDKIYRHANLLNYLALAGPGVLTKAVGATTYGAKVSGVYNALKTRVAGLAPIQALAEKSLISTEFLSGCTAVGLEIGAVSIIGSQLDIKDPQLKLATELAGFSFLSHMKVFSITDNIAKTSGVDVTLGNLFKTKDGELIQEISVSESEIPNIISDVKNLPKNIIERDGIKFVLNPNFEKSLKEIIGTPGEEITLMKFSEGAVKDLEGLKGEVDKRLSEVAKRAGSCSELQETALKDAINELMKTKPPVQKSWGGTEGSIPYAIQMHNNLGNPEKWRIVEVSGVYPLTVRGEALGEKYVHHTFITGSGKRLYNPSEIIIDPSYLQLIQNSDELIKKGVPEVFIGNRKELIEFFTKYKNRLDRRKIRIYGDINPESFVEMHYNFESARGFRSDATDELIARFPQYSGSSAKPELPVVMRMVEDDCKTVFSSPFKENSLVVIRGSQGNRAAKVVGFNPEDGTLKVSWMENGVEKTGSIGLERTRALGKNSLEKFSDLKTSKYPELPKEEIEKVIESIYRNPDKKWVRELTRAYNRQSSKIDLPGIIKNKGGRIGEVDIRFVGRGEVSSGKVFKEFGQFPGSVNDYITSDVGVAIGGDIIFEEQLLYNFDELLNEIIEQYGVIELGKYFGGRANIPEGAIKMFAEQVRDLSVTGF